MKVEKKRRELVIWKARKSGVLISRKLEGLKRQKCA